jgi:tetratricopeptide (TPR) repeat protein
LAVFTASAGASVGISSVYGHFQRHNPALVLSIDPDSALARFKAGQLAAQSGNEDVALVHWRRAAELEEHGISAFESAMSLGSVYGKRGILDQAAYFYELAAAKRPILSTWALTWLARTYSQNGRVSDAIATYERALRNISSMDVPDLAPAFRELAAKYDEVGQPDKAAATRDRARALGLK